jgi:molybdopterin adenylyltransferase
MKIGRVTLADPAVTPEDKWGADIEQQVARVFEERSEFVRVLVHDRAELRAALLRLSDEEQCPLIITTGGTGPGPRDIVPEVTLEIIERELPGFGDTLRHYSFQRGPVALLSRAVAGVRGTSLIVNLPSRPKAVYGYMKLLREAIVECIDQLRGVRYNLYTDPIVIPLEKWLPFLKHIRVRPDPRWE